MILKIIYLCVGFQALFAMGIHALDEDVPNPLMLSSNFFNFYDTNDPQVLKERIQKTIETLDVTRLSLPENIQDQMFMYITKIRANLELLARLKIEKIPALKIRLYKTSYTFEDIESLLSTKEQANIHVLKLEKERSSLSSLAKKTERHIDTLFLAYQKLMANTEEKLSLGFEIFSYATSLAVMKERGRILKEKSAALSGQEEDLQQEEEFAFEHLDMQNISLEAIEKQFKEQEELLAIGEGVSLQAHLSVPAVTGDSEEEVSEGYLSLQKSIRAGIEVALINAQSLELQTKIQIIKERKDDIPIDGDAISMAMRESAEITAQKDVWSSQTSLELDRIGHLGFLLDDQAIKTSTNPLARLAVLRYHEAQESLNMLAGLTKKLEIVNALIGYADKNLEKKQTALALVAGSTKRAFDDCCHTMDSWLHYSLFKVAGVPITLMGILEVLMILGGAYFFSWLLRCLISYLVKDKNTLSHSNLFILDRLLHYLILAIAAAMALMSVGLEPASIFWVLGALSVGIGFGLQMIVNNFASSLILLFSRTIKVQDYIQLTSGEWGQVMDISIQNTIVRTAEGIEIIIPNSELISTKFMNWTMHDPYKCFHIHFSVAYGSDKELVEKVVKEAALKVPSTIYNHPHLQGPEVHIVKLNDSGIDFQLAVWVNMYTLKITNGPLESHYLWEIESALTKHNIQIPFPQCDITLKSVSESAGQKLSQKNVMVPSENPISP